VSASGRLWVLAAGLGGFAALLAWGLAGLPELGHYPGPLGDIAKTVLPAERSADNVPTAIVFDLRGFDTLGEESILFAAVTGVALLLRELSGHEPRPKEEATEDDELRLLGLALVPPTLLLGLYLVTFGHLTPGGGFQGGVVLATAFALLYLGGGSRSLDRLAPHSLAEAAEGTGAGAFVVLGLLGLAIGGTFLENALPFGRRGDILSAGTIPALNWIVALAVAGAFVLLVREFLQELLLERAERE
jgi:multicomponent Na+:H+ antiporter subunit B